MLAFHDQYGILKLTAFERKLQSRIRVQGLPAVTEPDLEATFLDQSEPFESLSQAFWQYSLEYSS